MLRQVILFISLGILGLAGCSQEEEFAGPQGGDFVLQSADGPVDSKALRGNVLLIFFGYTHCPDICPASLAAGAQALVALTADERAKTRLIMISVDPERDTPERLKEYTRYFHTGMIGVTGTPEQVENVATSFGAAFAHREPAADGSYAVDHTANIYLVKPDGKLATILQLGTPTDQVVATIRKYLP